jgi:hypothetical protein
MARQLHYGATVRAVLLDEADARAVLAQPREDVAVRNYPAVERLRALNDALQGGATTGPRPASWTGETGRDANEPAFTYAFQFGARDLCKIGHAKDLKGRLADVSKHVPQEVLQENWRAGLQQPWATEALAYDMEQRVLALLRTGDSVDEVIARANSLKVLWRAALIPSAVNPKKP